MRSELVTDRHLARRAVIYIRQSSPHQVLSNQESLRLQYALRRRALGLGWRDDDVEVIDTDLGRSGARLGRSFGDVDDDRPDVGFSLLAEHVERAVAAPVGRDLVPREPAAIGVAEEVVLDPDGRVDVLKGKA